METSDLYPGSFAYFASTAIDALPLDRAWVPLSRLAVDGTYCFIKPAGDGHEVDWVHKRARLVPVRTIGWTVGQRARSMR